MFFIFGYTPMRNTNEPKYDIGFSSDINKGVKLIHNLEALIHTKIECGCRFLPSEFSVFWIVIQLNHSHEVRFIMIVYKVSDIKCQFTAPSAQVIVDVQEHKREQVINTWTRIRSKLPMFVWLFRIGLLTSIRWRCKVQCRKISTHFCWTSVIAPSLVLHTRAYKAVSALIVKYGNVGKVIPEAYLFLQNYKTDQIQNSTLILKNVGNWRFVFEAHMFRCSLTSWSRTLAKD